MKHTITVEYQGPDGEVTHIVRVTDEDRNLEHLIDDAVREFKHYVVKR